MSNNDNQKQPNERKIYLKDLHQWVSVSKTDYDNYYRDINAYRRRQQAHGRCVCPANKRYLCDMDCWTCRFHKAGDELSLDYTVTDEDGKEKSWLIYKNLVDFAEALSDEQKRHIQENITEEELALFDILTKPEIELAEKDRQQVKKAARQLLETLKKEKLVLDWRKKQQARAEVLYTIEKVLDDDLPRSFSTELYRKKCELVYQHVFDHYYGAGQSIYSKAS